MGATRPGGRTSRTRDAVLTATRELLVEEGSAGMRIERIAQRSGIHRSSIYRRWKTPAGIIADLASTIEADLAPPSYDDLHEALTAMATRLAHQLTGDGPALIRALQSWQDPDVRATLDTFWQARRREVAQLLNHHGSDADPGLVTRLVAGPIHYQAIVECRTPSPETINAAVRAALAVV